MFQTTMGGIWILSHLRLPCCQVAWMPWRVEFPLLFDGGNRRGTDVKKALALGASVVLIGRPYLHGLAVAGSDGVRDVIGILRRELEMAMALTGCPNIASISLSILHD
jgi:isopentenyl diphosphate isomerase/L-lactate dehydrogenase-like FMN-dependent dehydrogenase